MSQALNKGTKLKELTNVVSRHNRQLESLCLQPTAKTHYLFPFLLTGIKWYFGVIPKELLPEMSWQGVQCILKNLRKLDK